MKEFFMTSAIPYWLLFIITVISVGYSAYVAFRRDDAGNYIAADGSKHSSESARNARDTQIHNQRKNS